MYRSNCLSKCNQLSGLKCWPTITGNVKNSKLSKSSLRFNSTSSKRSSGNGVYLGASVGTVALCGVGAALYAKYDDDVRRSMESNLPFLKPVFSSFYGDLQTKRNASLPVEKDLTIPFRPLESKEPILEDSNQEILFGDEMKPIKPSTSESAALNSLDIPGVSAIDLEISKGTLKGEELKEEFESLLTPVEPIETVADSLLSEEPDNTLSEIASGKHTSETVNEVVKDITTDTPSLNDIVELPADIREDGPLSPDEVKLLSEVANKAALEVVLEASTDHLKVLVNAAKTAQHEAAESIRVYYKKLSDAVYVSSVDQEYEEIWKSAAALEHTSQEIMDKAQAINEEFKNETIAIKELVSSIRKSDDISNKSVDDAEKLLEICDQELHTADEDLQKAEQELGFVLEIQKIVLAAPEMLKEELKKFTPELLSGLTNAKEELNFSTENALLALALKRQSHVVENVSDDAIMSTNKFHELLEREKENIQKAYFVKLKTEIEEIEIEKSEEQAKQLKELEDKYDSEILSQLKRQASAHNIHLTEELANQNQRLNTEHELQMKSRLEERRQIYEYELEKNVASIHGLQSKISDIVDVERRQRRIQELWLAAQALNSALNECLFHGRTRTLMPELLSIVHLGGNGVLQEIVETVPEAAAMFGVIPEKELKQRFKEVKKVCKKVALVNEEGGGIGSYVLSYFKSLFVYSGWYQRNIDDPVDLNELSCYEILAKAEYFINEGDLEQAAKFMSQLKGAARKFSSDWLNETRMLLETRQTANLLLAYAASLSAGVEFQTTM